MGDMSAKTRYMDACSALDRAITLNKYLCFSLGYVTKKYDNVLFSSKTLNASYEAIASSGMMPMKACTSAIKLVSDKVELYREKMKALGCENQSTLSDSQIYQRPSDAESLV
jgi:hypothetical protein